MISNENILDLIPLSGEISKQDLHNKINEMYPDSISQNALWKRLKKLELKKDLMTWTVRRGRTNVLMMRKLDNASVEKKAIPPEKATSNPEKKAIPPEKATSNPEKKAIKWVYPTADEGVLCALGRRIKIPAGPYEDALRHVEAPDFVRDQQFREALGDSYRDICSVTCIFGRLLRDAFPTEPGNHVFDLALSLFGMSVRMTVADLRKHDVLKHRCNNCYAPFDPDRFDPRRRGETPFCGTGGARTRIPRDVYARVLREVAPPDDISILQEKACRDLLESFHSNIFLFTCVLARKVRDLRPTDDQVLDLAGLLVMAGVTTVSRDLLRRRILERQCAGCPYPWHSSPPPAPKESQAAPSIPAAVDAPPTSSAARIAACADQIAQFIDQIEPTDTKSKQGIPRGDIIQEFGALGFSENTINEALVRMTSDGTVYVPLPERFSLL